MDFVENVKKDSTIHNGTRAKVLTDLPYPEITVRREGRWYVIEGTVSDQGTRLAIIEDIPAVGGARRIVDRLRIGHA